MGRSAALSRSGAISGAREELVESRTKLINNVRGWMRTQLWRLRSGGAESFHKRVRAHAEMLSTTPPEHVERTLRVIELLTTEIREADAQVQRFAKTDTVCIALQTVPGVGPITAVRFRAVLDDVSRFNSAHAVESYLGLTPGENSSSERQRRTGITKAGSSAVRRMLVQAAWAAIRRAPNGEMGDEDCRAPREIYRRDRTRSKACRDLVCDLARRNHLSPEQVRGDGVARPQILR
jgi:transposase